MSAMEPLCYWIGINPSKLLKNERILLEAELLARISKELMEYQREQYKDYFRSMKFTLEMENAMLELNFVPNIVRDILSTEEYNEEGIAHYIDSHEEVVHDVAAGRNTNPSSIFLRRVIELHRSVRRDLYQAIIKKIAKEYLANININ